jgi:uncharacterized repeat protein (TIGR02543 family)
MIMNKTTRRGRVPLLMILAVLFAACTNPFFAALLGVEEASVEPGPGPSVYTVTFKLNDGTDTTWAVKTVTAPATTVAPADFPANPARTGYAFAGWNTAPDGSGGGFTASTTVTADITVYALWTAVPSPGSHMVTFKLNDGTETTHAVKTVTAPAPTVAPEDFPANPARSGYTFAGWNTRADGSGGGFTASTTVTDNITVYARWNPGASVQISLQPQPGDPPLSDTAVFEDESASFSAGSEYASWHWYWDGDAISGAVSDTYVLAANVKPPGIYELSVVVSAGGGVKLSARCRVTVNERGAL